MAVGVGGALSVGFGAGVGTGVGVGGGLGVGGFGVGFGVRAGVGVGRRVATGVGVATASVGVGRFGDSTALGEARASADGLGALMDSSLDGPATAFGAGLDGIPVADRTPPSIPRGTNTTASMAMATADAATTPAMRRWRPRELAGWACSRRRSGSWPRTGFVGTGGSTGMAGGWACSAAPETTRRFGIVGAGAPATPIR